MTKQYIMADRKPITQISNGKVTPPKRIVTKSESGEYKYIQKGGSTRSKNSIKVAENEAKVTINKWANDLNKKKVLDNEKKNILNKQKVEANAAKYQKKK